MTNLLLQHIGQPMEFHLACDGIDEADRLRLADFERLYRNVRVHVYQATAALNKLNSISSKAPPRLNRSVLLRILLPHLVPSHIKRLVYMDVDMLCLNPIDELWQINIDGQAVAAVPYPDHAGVQMCRRLGMSSERYCNAGMLLINIPAWRAQSLTTKVAEYFQLHTERLRMLEQDALNCVLDGDFIELDSKFNHMVEPNSPLMCKYSGQECILHFVNEAKAWTIGCIPEIYDLYWSYVRRSLWYDIQPAEPSTIKAAFLAAVTAEIHGQDKDAIKYYSTVARRLSEYYLEQNKKDLFDMEV